MYHLGQEIERRQGFGSMEAINIKHDLIPKESGMHA
jgi:hypothetical protein